MTALALTAITNFILACEAFFIVGLLVAQPKARGSAAWFWTLALLTLATSALLGGIDHGFFEPLGQTPTRKIIEHSNWFLIGVLTLLVFLTLARQFLASPLRSAAFVVAGLQLAVYTGLILFVDNFLVVILNYAPVMLLFLILNFAGLKSGAGSWPMIIGILLAFAASGVQAAGIDVFAPFDRNSLYHFGMMASAAFLYFGGRRLKTTA